METCSWEPVWYSPSTTRGWLAGGNTARNTAIVRANYLTSDGVRFYDESIRLFERLSNDLDFNILYSRRGLDLGP